jgi:GPI mannosyltransferase 1 subunit M
LTGNIVLHAAFGKALFALCDVVIGFLIHAMMLQVCNGGASAKYRLSDAQIKTFVGIWLFNPFTINVSTRGNAESIISLQVIAFMYLLLKNRLVASAVVYGLAVHTKIYPIIFAPALFFHLDSTCEGKPYRSAVFTRRRIVFTVVSAATCLLLTAAMYLMYAPEPMALVERVSE